MTRWPNAVDGPAARAGDLRDEPVGVEAVEKATDLGTLLSRVITKAVSELCTQVAVRERAPPHESDKAASWRPSTASAACRCCWPSRTRAWPLGIASRAYVMETRRVVLSGLSATLAESPHVRAAYRGG